MGTLLAEQVLWALMQIEKPHIYLCGLKGWERETVRSQLKPKALA